MWIPSPSTLAKAPAGTVFVLCRWVEFFDDKTPDTYRPRLCHLARIVEELRDVAIQSIAQAQLRKYLGQLKQECRQRLTEEKFSLRLCDAADLAAVELISLEATTPAVVAQEATKLTASGFTHRYETAALNRGRAEILHAFAPSASPRKFATVCATANRWLNLWATIGLNRGYILSLDFARWDEAPLRLPLDRLLDRIIQGINRPAVRFRCYLAVHAEAGTKEEQGRPGETPASVARLKNVLNAASIRQASPLELKDAAIQPAPNALIAFKEVDALSAGAALESFIFELQPVLNILGFYQSFPPAQPINDGWAGAPAEALHHYELNPLSSGRLYPRKDTVKLSKEAVAVYRSGRITESIANALEQYHMAISSRDWRVKFTTMWAALESLSANAAGQSVIARVTNMLVPIVTWRRMDKEIKYLGMSLCHHRKATAGKADTRNSLPDATANEVPAENVLLAVTKPFKHPHIVELLDAVKAHPLLSWRAYSVWEVFHDPATLVKEFHASTERLTWHIARIYRARNLLAHHGEEPPQARLLLDNLHFYLSTAISRILAALKENPTFGTREAIDYWQNHAKSVYDRLESRPETITVAEVLSRSRIRKDACPWASEIPPASGAAA